MKVKLSVAQMATLRYAGRGELSGTPDTQVYATGSPFPKTKPARRLVELGLLAMSQSPGHPARLVPTAEGVLVLARDAQ